MNFDEAGVGICLIWYLRYEDGLEGAEVGENANDLEGCFDLSNPIRVIREDENMRNVVRVYPNPATDVFKIAMHQMNSTKINVALYDFSGSNITSLMQRTNTNDEIIFDLKSLPKGIYLLQINDGADRSFSKKLIIN